MHYYKRNLGDYAKKAGRLSMLQHGAYTLLIDACYDREQFPTLEEAIDWTWASSSAEVEAVEFVLNKFFTLEEGRYVQNRIREEINDYKVKSEVNSRIAIAREANRKTKSTKRARNVDAPAQDDHKTPPNQEPLTNNHTEEPNGSVDSKLPTCQTQKVIDLYHEILPELPGVRVMSDGRRKAISGFWRWVLTSKRSDGAPRAITAADALEWIGAYFERAKDNDFLMGRSGRSDGHANWTCDLDFLLSERGKRHVIEKTKSA
jgi:uncharacterized protein YdaU (DUF1376 family)